MLDWRRETGPSIDIVAIVGAAGGCTAMRKILAGLPTNFPAPILYRQRAAPGDQSSLISVLQSCTRFQVRWPRSGERIRAGVVYLCPSDRTFLLHTDGTVQLVPISNEWEQLHAADCFLESVAKSFAERALAVVLSGATDDGADGVRAMHTRHGKVLIQDEASALVWGTPRTALATGCVDLVMPLHEMALALISIVQDKRPIADLRARVARWFGSPRVPLSSAVRDSLAEFLDSALAINRTDLGNIQLVDRTGGALAVVAHRGFGRELLEDFRVVRLRDHSVWTRATRRRAPVVVEDVTDDPLFAMHRDFAAAAGFHAVMSTPLLGRQEAVLGVLSTYFRRRGRPSPRQLQETALLGRRFADAMDETHFF
jgi:hypothetical protein